MGVFSAKFLLELVFQGGRLLPLPVSSAMGADGTTDRAAGVVEPFTWQRNPRGEQGAGFQPKAVLGGRR